MPWKTTSRRSLHFGPKVKLPTGHPLPEPADDMAVKIEEHCTDEKGDISKARDLYGVSDLASALPDVNGKLGSDEFCFDRYISDLEVDQESDDSCSLFNGSETTSTLGQSASSFMSWVDEAEQEKSKEVQKLVDEIDDAIYDAVPFTVTDQKALEILHQIKDSQLHLRITGEKLQNFPSQGRVWDEDIDDAIEVFASHGVYEENRDKMIENSITVSSKENYVEIPEMKQDPAVKCNEFLSHCESHCGDNVKKCYVEGTNQAAINWKEEDSTDRFREKVKSFVMDKLVWYVFSEASKFCNAKPCSVIRDQNISSLSEDEDSGGHLSPLRPNTREGNQTISTRLHFQQLPEHQKYSRPLVNNAVNNYLHVSAMTIHPLPVKSPSRSRYPSANFDVAVCQNQPLRHGNLVNEGLSKPYFSGQPSISITSLSKPNVLPHCVETEKGIKMRGYHSAAVNKKSGFWDRRFSVTAGHERFLEPLAEASSANKHRQQTSAPSSPAKWLRRHTLPPINANGLTTFNKESLVPLNLPVLGTGLTRLQFAKQLLEQTDHAVLWNTNGSFGIGDKDIKEQRTAKKTTRQGQSTDTDWRK